ncbi:hypothetical protein KA005_28620, partial [bacterium]|nr:hypothetical protein [bacterium]
MLIAEIRRKLASLEEIDPEEGDVIAQLHTLLGETKEDLLTSDVFGAIKYLPRVPYLEAVLRAIADRNPHADDFRKCIYKSSLCLEALNFNFWPSYPTPAGLPGSVTEPDVELSGPDILIHFEAKLQSGFGEWQVERELAVAIEQSKDKEFFLVLVTSSTSPPHISFRGRRLSVLDHLQSVSEAPEISAEIVNQLRRNSKRVLWISWLAIMAALEAAHSQHHNIEGVSYSEKCRATDMLQDLKQLMLMRGIQPFNGLAHIAERCIDLQIVPAFLWKITTDKAVAFRGLTSDVFPSLNSVSPLPNRKLFLLPATRNGAFKGITFAALPKMAKVL